MFDLLIKNGIILDGSGKTKKYPADLIVHKNKIKKIGKIGQFKKAIAKKVINASGYYVCPGFVDIQNHSDSYWTLFNLPTQDSLLYQGITTILGGGCGSSLAPLSDGSVIDSIQKWAQPKQLNVDWLTMQEFFNHLEQQGIALNFASLVGHSTLRRGLLKDEVRDILPEEISIMGKMLSQALKQGAWGMSSGLVYTHAKLAQTKELADLASEIEKGIYASHIRGEGEELIPAVKEAIEVARRSKVSVEISHLKALGAQNWAKMNQALQLIEQARQEGLLVNFDVYPYTTTGSVLYILLPDWVAKGGKKAMLARLKDPVIRSKVISQMRQNPEYDFSKVKVNNRTLDDPKEIIDVLLAQEGRGFAFMELISPDNLEAGLVHNLSFVCTNGFACSLDEKNNKFDLNQGPVHPRCCGAFPRFLGKYVRDENLLDWEKAIYKITYGPAQKIGFEKRGLLKKGFFADITIINPQTVKDMASFENPYQKPQGVEYVIVNGQIVVDKGVHTSKLPGQIIKS